MISSIYLGRKDKIYFQSEKNTAYISECSYDIVLSICPCFVAMLSNDSEYFGNVSFSNVIIFKIESILIKINISRNDALIRQSTIRNSEDERLMYCATSIVPHGSTPNTDKCKHPELRPIFRRFKMFREYEFAIE